MERMVFKFEDEDIRRFARYNYLDLNGRPVERDPIQYPYSYDMFVTYQNGDKSEIDFWVYSDRMYQQDHRKFDEVSQKAFGNKGQYFSDRDPEKIEMFLSEYFSQKIRLVIMMQGCNQATGYPLWWFGCKEVKDGK